MEREGASARVVAPSGRAGRLLAAMAAAALATSPVRGLGADLKGQADLTWERDDVGLATSEYLRQTYFLDYQRQFSPPISYGLSLRYQDDQGTTEAEGLRRRLATRIVTPTAGLNWRLETFGLSLVYRRNDLRTTEQLQVASQVIERFAGQLWVQPFQDGDVTVSADELSYSSPAARTRDDRLGINFRYASGALVLAEENRLQRFEDSISRLSRLSMGPRLRASYSTTFPGNGLVSGSYVLDYFRSEQQVRASAPTTVATELRPTMGLYVQDDLPLDTPPMTPVPALLDRAFDASAGISIGTGGASFQNLGLDLGAFAPVDQVVVHVRSSAGVPVPYGGAVSWTAFWSQDGLRWTQLAGVTASFNDGLSAWQVAFESVATRFVKVVNFGVNSIDTQVTELQAFSHETFLPDRTLVSSTVRQAFGLNLAGRPWGPLLLSYAGTLNADALTPYGGGRRWYTSLTNQADATLGPFGAFSWRAGLGYNDARQPFSHSQSALAASAGALYKPIERFDASLDVRRTQDWIESAIQVATVTDSVTAATHLVVYDSLRGLASVGMSRQQIVGAGTTSYFTTEAQLNANLTASLDVDLSASSQWTTSRVGDTSAQDVVPYIRIVNYQRYLSQWRYHPSPQLSLMASVGYLTTSGRGGAIRSVTGSWYPFPGGTVQLNVSYGQEVDPLTGQSRQRLSFSPIWNVNRYVNLFMGYNVMTGSGVPTGRQQNIFVTLSLRT
jgi:hypothetical protein